AAFEDAAAAASAARAARVERFKARPARAPIPSPTKRAKGSPRLTPLGPPPGAIVWKNILAFRRRSGFSTLIFLAVAPLAWGALARSWGDSMAAETGIASVVVA